jgi:hypothetical protein
MLNPNYTKDEVKANVQDFCRRFQNPNDTAAYDELWLFLRAIGSPPPDSPNLLGEPDSNQRTEAVGVNVGPAQD